MKGQKQTQVLADAAAVEEGRWDGDVPESEEDETRDVQRSRNGEFKPAPSEPKPKVKMVKTKIPKAAKFASLEVKDIENPKKKIPPPCPVSDPSDSDEIIPDEDKDKGKPLKTDGRAGKGKARTPAQVAAWDRCIKARDDAKLDRDELKRLSAKEKAKKAPPQREVNRLAVANRAKEIKKKVQIKQQEEASSSSEEEIIVRKKNQKKPKKKRIVYEDASSESEYEYRYEEVKEAPSQPTYNAASAYYSQFARHR